MKRGRDINCCVGAEDDACGIDEIEIGLPDLRTDSPVDVLRVAAGYAGNDVLDGARASKRGRFSPIDIEGLKAVKQITACPGPQRFRNIEVWPTQVGPGSNRSIGGNTPCQTGCLMNTERAESEGVANVHKSPGIHDMNPQPIVIFILLSNS